MKEWHFCLAPVVPVPGYQVPGSLTVLAVCSVSVMVLRNARYQVPATIPDTCYLVPVPFTTCRIYIRKVDGVEILSSIRGLTSDEVIMLCRTEKKSMMIYDVCAKEVRISRRSCITSAGQKYDDYSVVT